MYTNQSTWKTARKYLAMGYMGYWSIYVGLTHCQRMVDKAYTRNLLHFHQQTMLIILNCTMQQHFYSSVKRS